MFIRRTFKFREVMQFAGGHLVWLVTWSTIAVVIYEILGWTFLTVPWVAVSLIGIAVAFYVGFKNNAAYNRLWEARMIWGAIVNDSRSWGIACKHFVSDLFASDAVGKEEINNSIKELIYRHIAWMYTLRKRLLVPAPWEHLNASRMIRMVNERRIKRWGIGLFKEEKYEDLLARLLSEGDASRTQEASNGATQLLDMQAATLQRLRRKDIIEDFRHMDMQGRLYKFYEHQGKCERIKNYPFPRQYAFMSFLFISIFIILMPFGLMPQFSEFGPGMIWLTIPFTTLVGWVFVMMELVGDYSENPFEGLGNDIPMLSLCRTIEIDLLEMLGDENIPPPIKAVNDVLM